MLEEMVKQFPAWDAQPERATFEADKAEIVVSPNLRGERLRVVTR